MVVIMHKIRRLPDSELEIMKLLWDVDKPLSTSEIVERFADTKKWSVSTVITLTRRLAEKRFVKTEKVGRSHHFSPVINEEDYLKAETKSFLEKIHRNSFKSLVGTLYSNDDITKEDIEELLTMLKERD
jgi:BlaI family transcriptional regulator, penicillinase repressor